MCIYIYIEQEQNWSGVIVKLSDNKSLGFCLNNKD